MDPFSSETISSDSSTSDSCTLPQSQKKVHTRKTRRTEDLISLNLADSFHEDSKESQERKRHNICFLPKSDWVGDIDANSNKKIKQSAKRPQNISFLPKIDLMEDVVESIVPKTNKCKRNRHSLTKKMATFKIGRSVIERKLPQGHVKSKFPRIHIKLANGKKKQKYKMKMAQKESKNKLEKSDDAAEECHSKSIVDRKLVSSLKQHRKSKSLSVKNELENYSDPSKIVLKDLYVNLVPVEKTNLLSESQLLQLKRKGNDNSSSPLRCASFNNSNVLSKKRQTFLGKENAYKVGTPKGLNIPTKHLAASSSCAKNLHYKNNTCKTCLSSKTVFPCKVVLKRLTPEEIQFLTLRKDNALEISKNNSLETAEADQENMEVSEFVNPNSSVDVAIQEKKNLSELKVHFTELSQCKDVFNEHVKWQIRRLEKTRRSSKTSESFRKSMENCDETYFNPGVSSSPLMPEKDIQLQNLNNTPPVTPGTDKRLTYDLDANETKSGRTKNLTVLAVGSENLTVSDAGSENQNATYEIEAGSENKNATYEIEAGSENKNATYEIEAGSENKNATYEIEAGSENKNATYEIETGSSLKRSSHIRRNFEELSYCSLDNNSESSTYAIKSDRKSEKSGKYKTKPSKAENESQIFPSPSKSKNLTYELDKTDDTLLEKPAGKSNSDKDATFEIAASTYLNVSKNDGAARHSNRCEFAVTKTWPVLSQVCKRRQSRDLEIAARKKRRPKSCDVTKAHTTVHYLQENEVQPLSSADKQQTSSTPSRLERRRSTLTLEESVNNVALLKSICDSSDIPQKLSRAEKIKSQNLIKEVLTNKLTPAQLDFSNITIRKHWSSCSENVQDSSKKSSKLGLEGTSPPWSGDDPIIGDGTFEVNETDDFVIVPSSFREASEQISAQSIIEITDEEEGELVEEKAASPSSASTESSDVEHAKSSSRHTQRAIFGRNVIEQDLTEKSGEEDVEEELFSASSSNSKSSDSDCIESLTKQARRVTFGKDVLEKEKRKLRNISSKKITTPKNVSGVNNRRVTFSDTMSVIIIDDSPEKKLVGTQVRTNFLSADESGESSDEPLQHDPTERSKKDTDSPQSNKKGTVGRTPPQEHVGSPQTRRGSLSSRTSAQEQGRVQSLRFSEDRVGRTPIQVKNMVASPQRNRSTVTRTPTQTQTHVDSPQFNTRGTIGRTPIRSKSKSKKDSEGSFATPDLNKKINSSERRKLENELYASSTSKKTNPASVSKKTKMPDFASLHKKMYDKMLNIKEYSKRKEERAKLLLSGHKPGQVGSSLKKSASKQSDNVCVKKVSKKQLTYAGEPSTSSRIPVKRNTRKKPLLVSSTPKSKKNEKSCYTRYGFKVVDDRSVSKKDQIMAVANKTRPSKSNTADTRSEIKGVRSNRRFDLLMKMRQKQHK